MMSLIFNCSFDRIDMNTLNDWTMKMGFKTSQFIKCVKLHSRKSSWKDAHLRCLPGLQNDCVKSRYRMVKTIRLPVRSMESALSAYPSLQIVHLLRDPRAIMNSRFLIGYSWETVKWKARSLCFQMFKDIEDADRLNLMFPHRIHRIKYETLASDPIITSKHLYRTLGMEFSEVVQKYINAITHDKVHDDCVVCSRRANSTKHIDEWKIKIPSRIIRHIDRVCKTVYEKLNYFPV